MVRKFKSCLRNGRFVIVGGGLVFALVGVKSVFGGFRFLIGKVRFIVVVTGGEI